MCMSISFFRIILGRKLSGIKKQQSPNNRDTQKVRKIGFLKYVMSNIDLNVCHIELILPWYSSAMSESSIIPLFKFKCSADIVPFGNNVALLPVLEMQLLLLAF